MTLKATAINEGNGKLLILFLLKIQYICSKCDVAVG